MKKRFLGLLLLPLMLGACNGKSGIPSYSYNNQSINHDRKTGAIAEFSLLGPLDGFVVSGNYTFTWEGHTNVDYYFLEIASTKTFITDDTDEVYVKESNISNNRFDLNYSLPKKDITYYWKVTAVNKDHKQECNKVDTFYYKAVNEGELQIKIEDEQDWVLHKKVAMLISLSIEQTSLEMVKTH